MDFGDSGFRVARTYDIIKDSSSSPPEDLLAQRGIDLIIQHLILLDELHSTGRIQYPDKEHTTTMAERGRELKTVRRSTRVLDLIQALDGASIEDLSDETGFSLSTIHGYVTTLENEGYLTKEGQDYYVSLNLLNNGEYARRRREEYNLAEDIVINLANMVGHRVYFIVEVDGKGIRVHTKTGNPNVRINDRVGQYDYLHASAAGKSILAHLPVERVRSIVAEHGLPACTGNTITRRSELFTELEQIRERGISYNREESIEGLYAVGAPVKDAEDRIVGGMSVSGAKNRIEGQPIEETLPEQLLGAINELELNINNMSR